MIINNYACLKLTYCLFIMILLGCTTLSYAQGFLLTLSKRLLLALCLGITINILYLTKVGSVQGKNLNLVLFFNPHVLILFYLKISKMAFNLSSKDYDACPMMHGSALQSVFPNVTFYAPIQYLRSIINTVNSFTKEQVSQCHVIIPISMPCYQVKCVAESLIGVSDPVMNTLIIFLSIFI